MRLLLRSIVVFVCRCCCNWKGGSLCECLDGVCLCLLFWG